MTTTAFSQFTHQGRGMYVDKFFITTLDISGNTIVDQNRSILSISLKENELLQYAQENHITYLVLYDMYRVLGNSTYENYLCSFLQKAKTQYCIEYIGIASSCASMFNNAVDISSTEPISFSSPAYSDNIAYPGYVDQLDFVESNYSPGDSLFYVSEATKLNIRAAEFNESCAFKFDVMVTEYEFWNNSIDDCLEDNVTKDQKYERFQAMINNMDVIRDGYNSTHSGHQLFVEAYLGYLNQNTIYSHQTIANWIDGSYGTKRRIDRINLHYYSEEASKMYSRTVAGQNYQGYYNTRFRDFCQSTTNIKTNVLPILSAEYIPWGTETSYLGSWFSKSVSNTIFNAEKIWYNDWYDDAINYNPGTVGHANRGNAIAPGGALWFTSSQMYDHLNKPLLFTSNSPVCVGSGQNGSLQFSYQGPIERGNTYKFYITDSGSTTIRCGSVSSIVWPPYNGTTQMSLDLNTSLGSCFLPAGEYDAHLELTYAASCASCTAACSVYVAPPVRVSIVNSGKIVALTSTTVCQGNPVYLQASSTQSGTSTYQWYEGTSPIGGEAGISFAPDAASTGTKNISCQITSSVSSCSANLSNVIPVTVQAFPAASITPQSHNSCNIILEANPTGGSYQWHDGSTGSTYSTGSSGNYSVGVTMNGCKTNATYNYQKTHLNFISKTTSCHDSGSGTLTVYIYDGLPPYSLNWSGPVSGTMSGLSVGNATITNLPAGTYTITASDSVGCTRTLSSQSILSYPAISVITNSVSATCSWTNDGSAGITSVSGGTGGPYAYLWHLNGSTFATMNGLSSGIYNVDVKDNVNCISTVSINVGQANPNVNPGITISGVPGSSLCRGINVTFTASVSDGGINPFYQWKLNGINVGLNLQSYSSDSLEDGDQIICELTSSAMCSNMNPVASNITTMNIEEYPSMFNVIGGGSYCDIPGSGVPVELSGSQNGIIYQLLHNGNPISGASIVGNGSLISFGNQTLPGDYSIVASTALNCNTTMNGIASISVQSSAFWYLDNDNDGYGDVLTFIVACEQAPGYISVGGDCHDNETSVNPGNPELCNGIDDNCNGIIDDTVCNSVLYLKLYIQGYFSAGLMTAPLFNTGFSSQADDCDSIVVILIDAQTLTETETRKAIVKTNGESEISFISATIGKPYYIKTLHRSAIETWSSQALNWQIVNQYNFTDSASAAFGNNQVEITPGIWAFWSGDIGGISFGIQDGRIDELDIIHNENEVLQLKSGYFHEDLNGDGIVESSDFSILENNFDLGIQVLHP